MLRCYSILYLKTTRRWTSVFNEWHKTAWIPISFHSVSLIFCSISRAWHTAARECFFSFGIARYGRRSLDRVILLTYGSNTPRSLRTASICCCVTCIIDSLPFQLSPFFLVAVCSCRRLPVDLAAIVVAAISLDVGMAMMMLVAVTMVTSMIVITESIRFRKQYWDGFHDEKQCL